MKIYQISKPAAPAVITMKFDTYNAAIDFATKSGMMKASKPYKRTLHINGEVKIVWCVTMPHHKQVKKPEFSCIIGTQAEQIAAQYKAQAKPIMHALAA